jgi:ABC-type transport system involved in multi-copper enzyme maturation permease subunit
MIRLRLSMVLLFSSLFFLVLSYLLSALSIGEKSRLFFDLSLFFIHLSVVVMAATLGSWSINHEISNSNLWMILVGPVSRFEFFIGKYLGVLSFIILYSTIATAIVLFFLGSGASVVNLYRIVFCIWLEAITLLAMGMFFSQWTHSVTAAMSTMSIFLLGSWIQELHFLGLKMKSDLYITLSSGLKWFVPNFFQFNLRSIYFFENGVSIEVLLWNTLHSIGWASILLILGVRCFQRRDLV